jgi:hypothetical protein
MSDQTRSERQPDAHPTRFSQLSSLLLAALLCSAGCAFTEVKGEIGESDEDDAADTDTEPLCTAFTV